MNKTIWMYWATGWDTAPELVDRCRKLWVKMNPDWKVRLLTDKNLNDFIDIEDHIPGFGKKKIPIAAKSDIIRILLLYTHGGVWTDATVCPTKPLNCWLKKHWSAEFFAFSDAYRENPEDLSEVNPSDRLVASWFLAARNDNYIIHSWAKETIKYWKENDSPKHYFWFHYLFSDLYKTDQRFQRVWNAAEKISCDVKMRSGPHLFAPYTKDVLTDFGTEEALARDDSPVFKLSHHHQHQLMKSKAIQKLFKTSEAASFIADETEDGWRVDGWKIHFDNYLNKGQYVPSQACDLANSKRTHSIIMISYLGEYPHCASNRESKFKRAVNSFISNTHKNKELIIVSDGCGKTNAIYQKEYSHYSNIKLVIAPKQKPGYPGALRTIGLFLATGETVSYLDSDDYISPHFILGVLGQFSVEDEWCYYDSYVADINKEFDHLPEIDNTEVVEGLRKFRWTALPSEPRGGVIGSPNIAHKRNIREQCFWQNWDGRRGESEDWNFIQQIIKIHPTPKRLELSPGYYLCHYRPGGVDL